MKNILYILFMYFLIFENILAEDYSWSYPLDVDIHQITFNHSSPNGSVGLEDVSIPEYYPTSNLNKPAAYIVNQNNRKIKAVFIINNGSGVDNLLIGGDVSSGTGFGDFDYEWVVNNDPYGYNYFTAGGSVPSTVGIRTFQISWQIIAVNDELIINDFGPISIGTSGTHTYYTLLSTPQSPMEEPWTDVLEFSCDWASGTNNYISAIDNIAEELYSCGVTYDPNSHYTYPDYSTFNLTSLCNALSNPVGVYMDCRDFANFSQVLINSLGGNCEYIIITSSDERFKHNYLLPAGYSSYGYNNEEWSFHQVGLISGVVDASTKIDNDIDPTSLPNSWKLAKGDMLLKDYLDKLSEEKLYSTTSGICEPY